jgi:hypothetical protein
MIQMEIATAVADLERISLTHDSWRVLSAIALLEEVLYEFEAAGGRPWSAILWLDCANRLLQRSGITDADRVREHTNAALDLLARN